MSKTLLGSALAVLLLAHGLSGCDDAPGPIDDLDATPGDATPIPAPDAAPPSADPDAAPPTPDPDAAPPAPDPDAGPTPEPDAAPPPPEPSLQTRLDGFSIAGGADEGRAVVGGEVAMRLQFSALIADCPGCAVQVAVGAGAESACAYDAVPEAGVQTADFRLRAPASPGAFPVRWAAVLDGDCDAARAALAGGEAIGRLVVEAAPPPPDPSLAARLESLAIDGGGDEAMVRTGADVPMTLRFGLDVEGCPGCAVQVAVGLGDSATCAYDGPPQAGGLVADFALRAPAAPGPYPVRWAAVLDGDCADAVAAVAAGAVIGRVTAEAAPPPPSLAARLEALSIAGGADEARALAGSNVPISLDFQLTVADCAGCAAQVAVGVGGASVCAFDGVPGGGIERARFELPAPAAPGVYPVRWAAVLDRDCAAAQAALADGEAIGRLIAEAGPPPPMNQIPAIDDVILTRPTFATACRSVVEALAQDADGDALTYTWSGDAAGQGLRLELPGGPARTARVRLVVDDGRGGEARRDLELAVPACELPVGAVSNAAGDHAYLYVADADTYDGHRYAAAARFGYLATITSEAELDLVMGLRGGLDPWIGLWSRLENGIFALITGESTDLTAWCPGEPNNLGGEEFAVELYPDGCYNDAAGVTLRGAILEFELPGSADDVSAGGSFDRPGFERAGSDRTFVRITEPRNVLIRVTDRAGGCDRVLGDPMLRILHAGDVIFENDDSNGTLCSTLHLALEPGLYDLNVRGYVGSAVQDYRLEVDLDAPVNELPIIDAVELTPGHYGPDSGCEGIVRVRSHDPEGGSTAAFIRGDATGMNAVRVPAGPARDFHLSIAVDDRVGGVTERDVTFTLPGCEIIPGAVPNEAGDRAYLYVADVGSYDVQRVAAARRGGHLATLDAAERAFIVPFFDGMLAPWVGVWSPLRDHVFETITGEPLGEDPFCRGEPNNAGGDEYAAELWNIACLNDDGVNDQKPMLIEFELPGSADDVSLAGDHDRPAVAQGGGDRTFIRLTEPRTVRISLTSRDGACRDMDPVLRARFGGDVIAENDDFNGLCSRLTLELDPGLYDLNVVGFRGAALPEYRINVGYDDP